MHTTLFRAAMWAAIVGGFGAAVAAPGLRGLAGQTRKTTDPPVMSRGKLCQDLFLALDHRDLPGLQALLKKGADPNSRNGLEFTPIYLAAASYQMDAMKALLDAGADPNAPSSYGTPLLFAAITGNVAGAQMLFPRGCNVNAVRGDGTSVLMMACNAGNPALVAELLKRKADPNIKNVSDATALEWAARQGNAEVARMLIDAGAQVDTADEDGITPLMAAAMTGHAEVVKLLLQHGAKANARDAAGRSALILAAEYGDYADVVRALVDGGADTKITDKKGRTASSYAAIREYGECASILGKSTAMAVTRTPRQAATLSLKIVQSSIREFEMNSACISCHQEGLARMALGVAQNHGYATDAAVRKMQAQRIYGALAAMRPLHEQALKSPEAMKQVPLIEINEVNTIDGWLLGGMAAQKDPANSSTAAMAMVLARQQSPAGLWTFSIPRAPMQSSPFTFTALAVQALRTYGPKAHAAELAGRIAKAKSWLLAAPAQTSDDRAFRLLGLKWAGATPAERQKAIDELVAAEQPDGGWAQMPGMHSDAYATGQCLYALHVGGGVPVTDPVYQKGVQYLLRTQDDDGTWFVNKRAIPANNYFDAGFPHGESQYASFNGTCWAAMALIAASGK